jgi:hypothetical protein
MWVMRQGLQGNTLTGLKCLNVSTIRTADRHFHTSERTTKTARQCTNILDPNFVIGVWASASRQQIKILREYNVEDLKMLGPKADRLWPMEKLQGKWVQVSRLGMPLTNEAVIPIGYKDLWNSLTPYDDLATIKLFGNYFYNPELSLYMDDALFGGAVPALKPLRIQKNSLGAFGFGNGQDGLFSLKGTAAVAGTALDDAVFGTLLLPRKGLAPFG